MSHFGGPKNPPWARDTNSMSASPGMSVVGSMNQGMMTQSSLVNPLGQTNQPPPHQQLQYSQAQSGLPPPPMQMQYSQSSNAYQVTPQPSQVNMQGMPPPGIALPQITGSSVTYPAIRPPQINQPPPSSTTIQAPNQLRVFTGIVTKLHENFGFIDEEVFFQFNTSVKGVLPQIGERVLVEATFNPNMPFKWNATRVQVIMAEHQKSRDNSGRSNSRGQNVPPPLMAQHAQPGPGLARSLGGSSNPNSGRRPDIPRPAANLRHRSPPNLKRKKSRSPRRRSKSRSPVRTVSPVRAASKKPVKTAPVYHVVVPKINLDLPQASVLCLKSRYSNLYVPSDFFHVDCCWRLAFPAHRPFGLGQPCSFHIMSKDAPNPFADTVVEPVDADHLFSAKVFLLARPSLDSLYQSCCGLAPLGSTDLQHPSRLINFLVGLRGKEPLAIGGPWSPSLDGDNPKDNPKVLINTAIRTTKALTGIDLSKCTQWYRFAELHYHRPEEVHKGRLVAARLETVVLYLADSWTVCPSRVEWEALSHDYQQHMEGRIKDTLGPPHQEEEESPETTEVSDKPEPKHFSDLDPKTMKVNDLRTELTARGLADKGIRSQLIARLTKALKSEQKKEEEESAQKDEVDTSIEEPPEMVLTEEESTKKKEEEDRKHQYDKDRQNLEHLYRLPDQPAIIVHPSSTAKAGKFNAAVMSLSVLLDYRPEDNKEHTFEVSLFAELFNEMLMRDFGFLIYKVLVNAPEKLEVTTPEEKKDVKDEESPPPAKKRKEEDKKHKDDKRKEVEKEEEDVAVSSGPLVTRDPHLLLACSYFDLSHSGYFLDKDLEELLFTLGLCLSRAQVKKLLSKLLVKDRICYRQLTDTVAKDGDNIDTTTTTVKENNEEDEKLAKGNLCLLENSGAKIGSASSDVIMYQGAAVDIAQLMARLERHDQIKWDTDEKLQSVQKELDGVRKVLEKTECDYKETLKSLDDTQHTLSNSDKKYSELTSQVTKYKHVLSSTERFLHSALNTITEATKKEVKEVNAEKTENGQEEGTPRKRGGDN